MDYNSNELKLKKRSSFRLKIGSIYYSTLRYCMWVSKKFKFSKVKTNDLLKYQQFSHKTILLRKLKDVDMIYQHNKINNLKIAAKRINGLIVYPKETFSYWKLIGKPTYKKGYVDGMVLKNGKVSYGCGGGLCQLSNLIFWMTIHTPLEIVERHRHGYDVFPDSNRTQPFGSGATCFYPYGDLMIYNPTDTPFQICVFVGEEYLYGKWLSVSKPEYIYKIIEKNHEMKSEWWGGYSRHNQLFKQIYSLQGELLNEFLVVENHAMMMYSPFLQEKIKLNILLNQKRNICENMFLFKFNLFDDF